jgi:hypothetical protein
MVLITKNVTINRPRDEVYECWRDLDEAEFARVPFADVGPLHAAAPGPHRNEVRSIRRWF